MVFLIKNYSLFITKASRQARQSCFWRGIHRRLVIRVSFLDLRVACGKQAMCCRNHIAKMALPFWLKLGYLYLEKFEVFFRFRNLTFRHGP